MARVEKNNGHLAELKQSHYYNCYYIIGRKFGMDRCQV